MILFLTLLEDKKLDKIEDAQFRELHKISTVFKVCWLVKDCRKWLRLKIRRLPLPPDYTSLLFLFEECLFIVKKWDVKRPMNLLLTKLVTLDNRDFILRYVKDLNEMETIQLDYLLKLAGTDSTIFVDIMNKDMEIRESLTDNLRYLLKNINFRQIYMRLPKKPKYGQLFERIANLPKIKKDDLRLALNLLATFSGNEEAGPIHKNVITVLENKGSEDFSLPTTIYGAILYANYRDFFDVLVLVDLLLLTLDTKVDMRKISRQIFGGQTELAEEVINWTIAAAHGKVFQQISAQYVDMIIEALSYSSHVNKTVLIEILEHIRDNEMLSNYAAVRLEVSDASVSNLNWWTDSKATFQCQFSSNSVQNILPECNRQGHCGFLITKEISDKPPPVEYARCFLTWTAIYTFSALTSVDGAYSIVECARGSLPTRFFLRDLLKTPVLSAAAHVFGMKMGEFNAPFTTTWEINRDEAMYRNTEIHCHNYFSAADVELFTTKLATFKDGRKVPLPISLIGMAISSTVYGGHGYRTSRQSEIENWTRITS